MQWPSSETRADIERMKRRKLAWAAASLVLLIVIIVLIVSHSSGDGNVEFRNIFSECVGKKTKVSASSSGLYLTKLPSGNLTLQRDPFFWIVSLTNEDDGMDVELRDPLKREMPGVCAEDDGTAAATCRHGTIDAGHGNTVCIGCHVLARHQERRG